MTAHSQRPIRSAHFIGICGSGMKAIAQGLLEIGVQVSGSDIDEDKAAELRKNGATVHIGHAEGNLAHPDVVIYSTAIADQNPEIKVARERGIPIWHRSEMLGWFLDRYESILVAGTHGKTTTTTLTTLLLQAAGMAPWSFVGGTVREFHGNFLIGRERYAVAEADESDGSFLNLPRNHAIVMNIEDEHLNYWGTSDKMFQGFRDFVSTIPKDGKLVMCIDDAGIQRFLQEPPRPAILYSVKGDPRAAYSASAIKLGGSHAAFDFSRGSQKLGRVRLGIPGMQNVANATGALALALELGADFQAISEALVEFHGVDRRFTKIEAPDGYLIIDDYGHHPTEIRVTVESARRLADERGGRLIAVFQPHRYSRTESFFGQFASSFEQVDELIVTEIYSSGEEPIAGISGERLSAEIASKITGKTAFIADFSEIKNLIGKITKKNDMVLLVGAGTVTKLVNLLTTTHR